MPGSSAALATPARQTKAQAATLPFNARITIEIPPELNRCPNYALNPDTDGDQKATLAGWFKMASIPLRHLEALHFTPHRCGCLPGMADPSLQGGDAPSTMRKAGRCRP